MDLLSLIPGFGGVLWTVAALIVALSVIVFVHEYGHYIVGRWTGIHAEVFSLGFGPVIYSRMDRRGTRWQVAALPLGGYVKFLGDSNAASSPDDAVIQAMPEDKRRHTMHGAPLWARAATVAAGPVFNFAFSILVFVGFFLVNGVATETPVVGSLKPVPFQGESLRPGDQILAVNGIDTPDLETFVTVASDLPAAASVTYRIGRAGEAGIEVTGPFPFPPIADGVQPQSAAIDAGLEAGDVILSVNTVPVFSFSELREIVGASAGAPQTLEVWRAGEVFSATLTPRRMDIPLPEGGFETRWLIGLSGGLGNIFTFNDFLR